jgi:hypothetical protein
MIGFVIGIVDGFGGKGIVVFILFFEKVFSRNFLDEINLGVGIHPSIPMEGGRSVSFKSKGLNK